MDGNSFVLDENFDSGECRQMSMQGNSRVRFQAQHDHRPTLPQRRSSQTEKEQDQRPVMPKRALSNRSLLVDDDDDVNVDEEDSKTVPCYEAKRSAVIPESMKSKPDSNLRSALTLVASSKPLLPKVRRPKENKLSKKKKEGDKSSSKAPAPRSQRKPLRKQRSSRNVRCFAIVEALTIILEDDSEEELE
jgi:hypothetical protein